MRYAFENFDIERAYARPFGSNVASQRVLEKSGFTLEDRFSKRFTKTVVGRMNWFMLLGSN